MGFRITQVTEVLIRFFIHLSIFPLGRVVSRSEIVKAQEVLPSLLAKTSRPWRVAKSLLFREFGPEPYGLGAGGH